MLRKGMIEQQIEMLGAAMARISGKRSAGDLDGAAAEIRTAGLKITGLDTGILAALTGASLLEHFAVETWFDAGRCAASGALLHELAEITAERGMAERSRSLRAKAVTLLLTGLLHDPALRIPAFEDRLSALIERDSYHELPLPDQRLLASYHESAGRFAAAEDVLFAMRMAAGPAWPPLAMAFYDRMRARTEDELTAGDLSAEEVEAGWAEVCAAEPAHPDHTAIQLAPPDADKPECPLLAHAPTRNPWRTGLA